jgi:iron complex outermembrane receptor protein
MCVGNFNEIAALDLALTTNAVNIDYKKSLHDWNIKTGSMDLFRIILQIQGIKPLILILIGSNLGLMA